MHTQTHAPQNHNQYLLPLTALTNHCTAYCMWSQLCLSVCVCLCMLSKYSSKYLFGLYITSLSAWVQTLAALWCVYWQQLSIWVCRDCDLAHQPLLGQLCTFTHQGEMQQCQTPVCLWTQTAEVTEGQGHVHLQVGDWPSGGVVQPEQRGTWWNPAPSAPITVQLC